MKYFSSLLLLSFSGVCLSQNTDIDLLQSLNSGNSASWDNTNIVFSHSMVPICITVPASAYLYGVIKRDSTAKRNSYIITGSLLASTAITMGLKYSVNRERPYNTYPSIIKKTEGGDPSFPSGHTSSAFATATSISMLYPKWYVIAPSFLWASAVGYSRMELGVHYPSDVAAGAIIGVGSSWLSWKANKWLSRKKK